MKLQGIFVLAATPFDHTGAISRVKVQHNFDKWCRTEVTGFVVGSLAGEGPLLTAEEKTELVRIAAPQITGDRTLVADVSSEGVHVAAELARAAAAAGAHAVISRVPHQYRNMMYGPDAQALYFRALADQSPVPVIVQNAPMVTGIDLAAPDIGKLSAHPNIAGVMETGTPPERIAAIRIATGKDFAIFAGTEASMWPSLKAGANGAMLSFASAAPYAAIAVWEAFRTREEEAAADWQDRIGHPSVLTGDWYGVAGLKHAMDLNGYYGGPPRLPFVPLGESGRREIEDAFRDLKG